MLAGYILSKVCLRCSQSSRLTSLFPLQYVGLYVVSWPLKFRWSSGYICNSSYYQYQIRSINLYHCCHIFPWLCAWGGCTIICYWFHIYPEKAGIVFLYHCAVLWFAQIIEYFMAQWSHDTTSLSSLWKLFWKYWASKMFVRYILSSVCLRLSQLSHSTLLWQLWEYARILYFKIIIKSEVWTISHCLGLSCETMLYSVCLSMFL